MSKSVQKVIATIPGNVAPDARSRTQKIENRFRILTTNAREGRTPIADIP
jgi:hypothetical protein